MSGMFYKVTYTCEKVREFMYDYLEDSLPTLVSIRFHMHLNGCPECREYLFLYKKAANAREFRAEKFREDNPAPQEFLDSTLDFLRKEGIAGPEDSEDADPQS
jgi:predicted anti-sigma-YlaC factor YlaD